MLTRAVESAREDYAKFMQEHQQELYQDIAERRAELAASVAEAARDALRGFGQWSDLAYTLRSLQPPVAPPETGPPGSEDARTIRPPTNSFVGGGGIQTAQRGPDRGAIEQALAYLMSLDTGPAKGDESAA